MNNKPIVSTPDMKQNLENRRTLKMYDEFDDEVNPLVR